MARVDDKQAFDEKQVAAARVYSRAMLDLAEAEGQGEALLDELRQLTELIAEREDFHRFMVSPLVDVSEREKFLEKNLRGRASDLLVNALQVINQHGRLPLLETIAETYRAEIQERHGRVDVRVTTAVPLGDEVRRQLTGAIEKMTQRTASLEESVDPALIGGLVVRIGDRKIDTSVATELRKLRRTLGERAAQEILKDRLVAAE